MPILPSIVIMDTVLLLPPTCPCVCLQENGYHHHNVYKVSILDICPSIHHAMYIISVHIAWHPGIIDCIMFRWYRGRKCTKVLTALCLFQLPEDCCYVARCVLNRLRQPLFKSKMTKTFALIYQECKMRRKVWLENCCRK